jgi:PIN domain nuclease of toxin-antitoxin system
VSDVVLDASAVLAFLQQEPGAARVELALLEERCHLLTINLAEVLSRLSDWRVPVVEAEARIAAMDVELVPFDRQLARVTAELRQPTRNLGLSLGDRACLALARVMGGRALTADRSWAALDLGISTECIRPTL